MTTQEVRRKLAAILSADVKGYSHLMSVDEVGTIQTLNAYKEVMARLIQRYHGRVVDALGDNILAEFSSVVEAVQCAVEIQKELKTRNADLPENCRMEFRIGVNLGDVVEDGDRILGDGVNIAARLESLSEAGGICICGTVFDQVENKLELDYQYLGEQTVKNIEKPLRVYRVLMQPRVAVTREVEKGKAVSVRRMPILLGAVTFLVLVVIVGIWWLSMHRPSGNLTSAQKMAYPLPDKVLVTVPPYNYLEAAVEIARLEKMLAAMDNKIATIKNDGLPALQTMVEEREKQQRRLDELRKKRQQAIARDNIAS
jgi:class 3 adenylate cyclase